VNVSQFAREDCPLTLLSQASLNHPRIFVSPYLHALFPVFRLPPPSFFDGIPAILPPSLRL